MTRRSNFLSDLLTNLIFSEIDTAIDDAIEDDDDRRLEIANSIRDAINRIEFFLKGYEYDRFGAESILCAEDVDIIEELRKALVSIEFESGLVREDKSYVFPLSYIAYKLLLIQSNY